MRSSIEIGQNIGPFVVVGQDGVLEEKIGRVSDDKSKGRIIDGLNPEKRPLLLVGHDQEVLELIQTNQSLGKTDNLGRVVFHFAKTCVYAFHFFKVLPASLSLRMSRSVMFQPAAASMFS